MVLGKGNEAFLATKMFSCKSTEGTREESLKLYCLQPDDRLINLLHQAVVKAMELLAQEGKIKEKMYGKQKIYFADQVSLLI